MIIYENLNFENIKFKTKESELKRKQAIKKYITENISIKDVCKEYKLDSKSFSLLLKKLNIPINKHINKTKYSIKDENIFNSINTDEIAYWYGFLIADGNIQSTKLGQDTNCLRLRISDKDYHHLLKFNNLFYDENFISIESKSKNAYKIKNNIIGVRVYRKKIIDDLIDKGLTNNKSENEFINLDKIPEKLLNSLIRGIFDGDGWISNYNNRFEFGICSSIICCKQIQSILKNNNIESYISKNNNAKDNKLYRIRIFKKSELVKLYNFLYFNSTENTRLSRKYEIFKNI